MEAKDRVAMLMNGEKPVEAPTAQQQDVEIVEPPSSRPISSEEPTESSATPNSESSTPAAPEKSAPPIQASTPTSSVAPIKPITPPSKNVSAAAGTGVGHVVAPTAAVKPVGLGLAAATNARVQQALKPPPGLKFFNTNELGSGFFHGCVYGETGVRKTVTAAMFGKKEDTLIVLTRRKEQMIPLMNEGYNVALVEDADALKFALMYPEATAAHFGYTDWASKPDRTLVLDDATEAVAMLLEDNNVIDGKEVKDRRRTYSAAGEDLKELSRSIMNKPMNFVMVALAKVKEFGVNNDEKVLPDLPPSMLNMLLTDLEFVFYINPGKWKLTTERDFFSYTGEDKDGKEKTFRREIFAKYKLPIGLKGQNIILREEEMDLRAIWNKVKNAKAPVATPAKSAAGTKPQQPLPAKK